ncbi:hypothetical protein [Pseudorhodoplanes sp.]|uniref:hypothetical protein n=1 Tax=Pseudorhodoplanes sp. TaxID=1934341 RepID=UPI003D0CB2CC
MLKNIAGLVLPETDTIAFRRTDIAGMGAPDIARLGIGYVPQGRGLFADMSVADNLALGRLARALSGNVSLLLLDEPFEGLAPAVTLELFKVFDRLRQHISIVIVEHNLDLVLALADRVFVLERGTVFHQGPAQPLLDNLDYRKQILWL